jgi:hypothetical protein
VPVREVDEVVYGLSRALTTTVNGFKRESLAGASVLIPRCAVHRQGNLGAETSRTLSVLNPAASGAHISRKSPRL